MSHRNLAPRPRMVHEAYYTPPHATHVLIEALPVAAMRRFELWEPAAGAGHVARELERVFGRVTASDLHPAACQVHPVVPLDFLASSGLSGLHPLAVITNPPYGRGNRQAIDFLQHAFAVTRERNGLIALLLPFEFDAAGSRNELCGEHPAFSAKITVARRIRWMNLPQSSASPMSHHAWFIWSFDARVRSFIQKQGVLRTR